MWSKMWYLLGRAHPGLEFGRQLHEGTFTTSLRVPWEAMGAKRDETEVEMKLCYRKRKAERRL